MIPANVTLSDENATFRTKEQLPSKATFYTKKSDGLNRKLMSPKEKRLAAEKE